MSTKGKKDTPRESSSRTFTRAEKHVKALKSYPMTVKELKQWMGLVNYFVSHIHNRGELFVPLCALLKKDVVFNWTRECEEAMREINEID